MTEKQQAFEIDDNKRRVEKVSTMAEKHEVIEIDDSCPSPFQNGSPLRPIFCLKNREEIKKFEEEEECFILEFDPYKDSDVLMLTDAEHDYNAEAELSVVAERGQSLSGGIESNFKCSVTVTFVIYLLLVRSGLDLLAIVMHSTTKDDQYEEFQDLQSVFSLCESWARGYARSVDSIRLLHLVMFCLV
ncbi:hypothetical protein C2S51_022615 [Perilla frutescens var. frutescens]|nr:hypothetical protein C2S51_022615 [Perilla frutescens var. frutescens]